MLSRMTRTRTTVTLPDDLLAHARAVAPGGNLSAYVEHALRAQQLRDAAPAVRAWREQAGREADAEELTDIFGADIA